MPFTPTHLVAILPFWPLRNYLPLVAFAIGSMVPDIPLVFPIVDYAQTHSPEGLFTTCLPFGVALYLLFEILMRRPLIALLPHWFQKRLETSPRIPTHPQIAAQLFFYSGIATAIIVGALTHQTWDAFTHQDRWGTKWVPLLETEFSIAGSVLPGYKLFQYGSTLVGLPLLAALGWSALNQVAPDYEASQVISSKWKAIIYLMICLVPTGIGVFAIMNQPTFRHAIGMTIKLSGSIIVLGCLIYCGWFQALAIDRPEK